MIVKGKYTVIVKDGEDIVNKVESENTIVTTGLDQIVEWMKFDGYGDESYPGLREVDTTGMTVSNAGFTNPNNAVDGSDSSYTTALINATAWDTDWWKIDFGENKDLMAMYIDWYEDDTSYGGDYKFEWSEDDVAWTDFDARMRAPQDATRGKVLLHLNTAPPFAYPSGIRYFRLNGKRFNNDDNVYIYQMKFYERNFVPQPPMVMALGTGTNSPALGDTDLQTLSISKKIINITEPNATTARFIMSLDGTEGNDTTFTEAGMFYCSDHYKTQDTSNVDSLFSRALFAPSWSKTSGQTADVYYEIQVSNP